MFNYTTYYTYLQQSLVYFINSQFDSYIYLTLARGIADNGQQIYVVDVLFCKLVFEIVYSFSLE